MALSDIGKKIFADLEKAHVLIGIPSYNNKDTIGFVIKEAVKGIKAFDKDLKAIVFNADGGSTDGTPDEVKRVGESLDIPVITLPYEGIPGKGSALFAIIEAGVILDVEALIFLDSDLRSVRGWWIELFLNSILNKGYDYLTPYYIRHKYDGTITNNIVYPIVKGIFGIDIRQPIGGDFGLSGRLTSYYAGKIISIPTEDAFRFGIDIYLTTEAITGGFKIGQVQLGAKIHDVKDPGKTLAPMFVQVTNTLFTQIKRYENKWRDIESWKKVDIEGNTIDIEPEDINVDTDVLFKKFQNGLTEYADIYKDILTEENYNTIYSFKEKERLYIPSITWAHIIYDYVAAFYKRKKEIIETLLPLYFGKILSFVNETSNMNTKEAEILILKQAEKFWEERKYLLDLIR